MPCLLTGSVALHGGSPVSVCLKPPKGVPVRIPRDGASVEQSVLPPLMHQPRQFQGRWSIAVAIQSQGSFS